MKKTTASLLFHPAFWVSLFLLLMNDTTWKYAYHNGLTGKLSDVAGLLVLAVFCRVVLPRVSCQAILLFCAAFFCWWKSPLSQPVIAVANNLLDVPVRRVIDDSDLLALAVLPLAARLKPRTIHGPRMAAMGLRWVLGLLSFTSFCSTSVYRNLFQAHPLMTDVYFNETFTQKKPAAAILQLLASKGITVRRDSVIYYPVTNQSSLYYKRQPGPDSGAVWQQLPQKKDSLIYVKREGLPFYLIPTYSTETRSIRNIRFTLQENKQKTKTKITVQTFQPDGLSGHVIWNEKEKKPYKELFEKLFTE